MMNTLLRAFIVSFLLLFGGGVALASTADGDTPAVETVCEGESGAAFGLCNAYCEAMDCDLANDGDSSTEPNASATACQKVADQYTKLTDKNLPCEKLQCPCWDTYTEESLFNEINQTMPDHCEDIINSSSSNYAVISSNSLSPPYALQARFAAFGASGFCEILGTSMDISEDIVEICRQEILNQAALLGIMCVNIF